MVKIWQHVVIITIIAITVVVVVITVTAVIMVTIVVIVTIVLIVKILLVVAHSSGSLLMRYGQAWQSFARSSFGWILPF